MTRPLLLSFASEDVVLNGQGNEEALKMIETYQLLLHADDGELLGGKIRFVREKIRRTLYYTPLRKVDRRKEHPIMKILNFIGVSLL